MTTNIYLLQLTADPDSKGEQITRAFRTAPAARDALDRHLAEIEQPKHDRDANHGWLATDEGDLSWDIFQVAIEE